MGDVGASPATFGMNFRGQRIISATLTSISESKGLTSGADVIFGGCSAGARGAMVTLDNVASMLPTGVRVRGLLDSGLWLDETPLDPTAQLSLQEQTQMAQQLYVAQSVIPAGCASAYPGEEWHCIYGQYRMPFVKTSYFINSAQFDSFQMIFDMGGERTVELSVACSRQRICRTAARLAPPDLNVLSRFFEMLPPTAGNVPHTGGQVMYANAYQQATQAEMKTLVGGSNGVFSTSCLAHCLTQDTAYLSSYNANGQSFAQAITEWLNGGSPVDISQCQGYANCVVQCPGGSSILDIQEATADSTPAVQEREIEGQEEHAERAEVEEAGGATTGAGMPAGEQPQGQGGAASWPYQSTQQSGNGNSWMQQGRHRKLLGEGESAALLML